MGERQRGCRRRRAARVAAAAYATSMTLPRPDLELLSRELRARGLPCADLHPFDRGAKRFVVSDGRAVVARCSPSGGGAAGDAAAELGWAHRFAAVVPVQRPLLNEPFDVDGWTVTAWEYVPSAVDAGPEHAAAHGALLRKLHDGVTLTPSEKRAPSDQLRTARARLPALAGLRPDVAPALTAHVAAAQRILDDGPHHDNVGAHGDSHDRNLVVTPAGGLVLIDFDSAGPAPRTLDLVAGVFTYRNDFGDEAAATRFLNGYGTDAVDMALIEQRLWVRLVRDTCARAQFGEDVRAAMSRLDGWSSKRGAAAHQ